MALKVHHLRPAPGAHTPKTRKGRGEGSKGKTAGRGTKGTKARGTVPASFEGGQMPLHMRIPKLKGFKNPNKVDFQVVNVATINKLFPEEIQRVNAKIDSDDDLAHLDADEAKGKLVRDAQGRWTADPALELTTVAARAGRAAPGGHQSHPVSG
mgnify:CR=1 FL=1